MGSVNRAILIGNLGQDPDLKHLDTGQTLARLSIATTERWRDAKSGELQERTEWHRVIVWGRTAELVGEHLSKGRQVYVEGRLQTRKWQDKDGHDRYSTEIVAQQVTFLGGTKIARVDADDQAEAA
jgi:single-strand DNA-binding protein